jgi:hypothetical protein
MATPFVDHRFAPVVLGFDVEVCPRHHRHGSRNGTGSAGE